MREKIGRREVLSQPWEESGAEGHMHQRNTPTDEAGVKREMETTAGREGPSVLVPPEPPPPRARRRRPPPPRRGECRRNTTCQSSLACGATGSARGA